MAKVESFTGPVTLLEITEWLSRCEESFEASAATLTDKQKILAAGSAVAKSQDTKTIYDWWTKNRKKLEGKTWNEFRDAIKDKALSKSWRMKALLDFYSTTQGSPALEDYLSLLEERKFVIDRGDPVLNPVDDLIYKCLLLSNATPDLVAHVLKHHNDILAFAKADPDDVKDWLRKYDTGGTNPLPNFGPVPGPAPISSPPAAFEAGNSRAYIITGLPLTPYKEGCTLFNDLVQFPPKAAGLGDSTKITVWHNNDATYPMIERYEFVFTNPSLTAANPQTQKSSTFSTLTFSVGEYISSVTLSFRQFSLVWESLSGPSTSRNPVRSVSGMMITSSNPANTLSIGVMSDDKATFTAPSGWRIVGFYGMSRKESTLENGVHISDRCMIDTMGAIYAVV